MTTQRLEARVRRDFTPSEADVVLTVLADLRSDLPEFRESPEGAERVLAAVVLLADGNSQRLRDAAAAARTDWRDVLVAAGLAQESWRDDLAEALRPA